MAFPCPCHAGGRPFAKILRRYYDAFLFGAGPKQLQRAGGHVVVEGHLAALRPAARLAPPAESRKRRDAPRRDFAGHRRGASIWNILSAPGARRSRPRASRRIVWLLAAAAAVFTWGCFHPPTPYLPQSWPETADPLEVLADKAATPVLQVIIAYNVYWPNHTALRMTDGSGRTLFWDPAGGYGKTPPRVVRHSDLISQNAPDLARYMLYRWSNNDQAVEIFEWRLSPSEARRLSETLQEGAARTSYGESGFRTATPGFFCNAAVSRFLYQFGRPSIAVSDSYLLPNLLSRDLYRSHPHRVMVLNRHAQTTVLVLTPPDRPPEPDGFYSAQPRRP
jgi:hypothetical protein